MARIVRFGDFEANLDTGELRKHGHRLRLATQPFQVLNLLLSRPGELVTREEFRTALWPGDVHVDFDHSLNAAVKKLRQALNDSAETPRYIETLPKRGYRFIGPTEVPQAPETQASAASIPDSSNAPPEVAAPLAEASAPALTLAGQSGSERKRLLYVAVAVAMTIAISIGYWKWKAQYIRPAASSDRTMLAVLPFDNLTGDARQEYLSDGLTEELITELGGIQPERLGVIARTSVMAYKHAGKRVDEIGRDLGVAYVMEGSVREAGGRIRVAAQLIRTSDQAHVWAQEFDSSPRDVLIMEADVARKIAAETQVKLDNALASSSHPVNPEAYEYYLKGRYFWNQRTDDGLRRAIEYFEKAIDKDPLDARSYSGLADAYVLAGSYLPPQEANAKARAAAKKALELNPSLAEAHVSLGLVGPDGTWDWAGRERELLRGIALNPNYSTGHHWYGDGYLSPMCRLDEALAEMRKAEKLDPLSPIIATDVGKELYFLRRYDDALAQLHKVQEFAPNYAMALEWTRFVQISQERYADALQTLEREKPTLPEPSYLLGKAIILGGMGRTREARSLASSAVALRRTEYVNAVEIALAYSYIGDKDTAFQWLEKAYAEQSGWLTGLRASPAADKLRGDPRLDDLARRVGLPAPGSSPSMPNARASVPTASR